MIRAEIARKTPKWIAPSGSEHLLGHGFGIHRFVGIGKEKIQLLGQSEVSVDVHQRLGETNATGQLQWVKRKALANAQSTFLSYLIFRRLHCLSRLFTVLEQHVQQTTLLSGDQTKHRQMNHRSATGVISLQSVDEDRLRAIVLPDVEIQLFHQLTPASVGRVRLDFAGNLSVRRSESFVNTHELLVQFHFVADLHVDVEDRADRTVIRGFHFRSSVVQLFALNARKDASPKNAIGVRRRPRLLARVVLIGTDVVLVGRRKLDRTFEEFLKDLQERGCSPSVDVQGHSLVLRCVLSSVDRIRVLVDMLDCGGNAPLEHVEWLDDS